MNRESVFFLFFFIIAIKSLNAVLLPSSYRDNATDAISSAGYGFQAHEITTSDGYILKIHRVLPSGNSSLPTSSTPGCPVKPAIFLMHGFISSSMEFLFNGNATGKALSYELVDSGYDVFLGNSRGGYFTETHATLSPTQNSFWDFTLHEIANYDIAESIDYVRTETGSAKIFFHGNSLGTTEIMILLSEKPQYNDKLIQVGLLAPIMWVGSERDDLLSSLLTGTFYTIVSLTPVFPFKSLIDLITLYDNANCVNKPTLSADCALVNTLKSQLVYHWAGNGELMDPSYASSNAFIPQRVSSKMIRHMLQMKQTRRFRRYLTWILARSVNYDLSNVKVPIRIQRAEKDPLMKQADYDAFLSKIQSRNATINLVLQFGHSELVYGINSNQKVFKDVVASVNYEKGKYYGAGGACAAVY